eukprot:421516-Alexandrium_andersonii.AAC.1
MMAGMVEEVVEDRGPAELLHQDLPERDPPQDHHRGLRHVRGRALHWRHVRGSGDSSVWEVVEVRGPAQRLQHDPPEQDPPRDHHRVPRRRHGQGSGDSWMGGGLATSDDPQGGQDRQHDGCIHVVVEAVRAV